MTKQLKNKLGKSSSKTSEENPSKKNLPTSATQASAVSSRRKLIGVAASLSIVAALPKEWSKPFVNTVVIPAHAETSPPEEDPTDVAPPPPPPPPQPEVPPSEQGCSGFETEPIAEPIVITVSDTQIAGPIIIERTDSLTFSGFQGVATTTECSDTDNFSEEINFDGTIDSANNQITGNFILRQFCGQALVCEQITTYTASQTPAVEGDDLGTYNGTATGTLRCCIDFL